MPGKPKPGKGSKKRPASGGPSRNADRKKDETRAKRKRPVRPLTSTDAGASTADLPSHFSGGPEPEPVPSSDESDIENFIRGRNPVNAHTYVLAVKMKSHSFCESRLAERNEYMNFLLCVIITLMCFYMYILVDQFRQEEIWST